LTYILLAVPCLSDGVFDVDGDVVFVE